MLFLPHDFMMATAPSDIMFCLRQEERDESITFSFHSFAFVFGEESSLQEISLGGNEVSQLKIWILKPDSWGLNFISAIFKSFDFVHVT